MQLPTISLEQLASLPEIYRIVIPPEYEDRNRHMNIRWYLVVYDEAGDAIYPMIGLRARARITALSVRLPWSNGVVPLAVEVGGFDLDGGHLGFGDLDALVVDIFIEPARDGEAFVSGCAADQLDDGLVADQRLAAPVLGDEGEQAVLYLVPLAGAGRQMRDSDGNSKFVGQDLQFPLPQAHTRAVAAAAIGVDQQPRGDRVALGAEFMPPATDALDGKGGGIVADAEIDPSDVVGNVIDAVGHRLAQTRDREIVHPDRLRLTLRSQLPPAILEVSDKLLLLCVDGDHWLAGSLERLHLGVDVRSYVAPATAVDGGTQLGDVRFMF